MQVYGHIINETLYILGLLLEEQILVTIILYLEMTRQIGLLVVLQDLQMPGMV
jgi:hypothetical protein